MQAKSAEDVPHLFQKGKDDAERVANFNALTSVERHVWRSGRNPAERVTFDDLATLERDSNVSFADKSSEKKGTSLRSTTTDDPSKVGAPTTTATETETAPRTRAKTRRAK